MEIHVLDVGAGACTIVRHENGGVSVIDIARGSIEVNPFDWLRMMGVECVARLISTRPHPDRMDGLKRLLHEYAVRNFWHSNTLPSSPSLDNLDHIDDFVCYMDILLGKNTTCREIIATAGYASSLCNIEVLSPTPGMVRQETLGFDDKVLVLLLTTQTEKNILFAEGVSLTAWRYMLADDETRKKLARVDVLITSGEAFLVEAQLRHVLRPEVIITRDRGLYFNHALIGVDSFCLFLPQSGSVILDDADGALGVYVTKHNRLHDSQIGVVYARHPVYDAWLIKRL